MTFADSYLKAIYHFWARVYDWVDQRYAFDRTSVIAELKIKKDDKILEVGVGTGLNLAHYPPGCHVMGVDFSKAMLDKARQKNARADVALRLADARDLPFKNDSFDAALTTYVLRVSPEPRRIMHEVSRVVKPGGRFVVLDQFKGKNRISPTIMQPIKILLGSGKDYDIHDLIIGTSWRVVSNARMGIRDNTRLVVLENRK